MSNVTFEISETSHDDHISAEHLSVIREICRDGMATVVVPPQAGIFIATVELPEHLASVPSALRGPASGEAPVSESQAFYGIRGEGRPNLSRLTNLPSQPTRKVTVVVGNLKGIAGEGKRVRGTDGADVALHYRGTLFTAYGGPCAPQEPGDPYLAEERLAASQAFWAEHALSVDAGIPVERVTAADHGTFADPERSRLAVEGYASTTFSLDG